MYYLLYGFKVGNCSFLRTKNVFKINYESSQLYFSKIFSKSISFNQNILKLPICLIFGISQTSSWIAFLLWLVSSGFCTVRLIRNRRARSDASYTEPEITTSDTVKIADQEPTA